MGDEKKSEGCCGSGCTSCGKKFVVGVLVGIILTAAALGICMGTKCAVSSGGPQMCPFTKINVQK